ncbi:degydrogenase [Lactiplantibacillus fabifermentans T30PCM01]|uniref:Degydrogenase n=1 Tax=Lactiplantibacillus fabifermentans T30PCM01 TaxID=1400520 RepID=W6T484_9LACO|nr:alcohol dehydrogenase catalytic domain-containing protein [Lactiplantibacillus fabifermentans]ETY72821.1 degydrogenase [Lactiplantibacillus fabifermentans T30PCM01]
MQAAVFVPGGPATEIEVKSIAEPEITANEVLLQVRAAAVDNVDTYVRRGIFKTELATPAVIGRDAVGTVLAVGPAVTKFKVGDWVWTNSMGYEGRPGATSEQLAVPEDRLYAVPDGVDPVALVAAVHAAATAQIVLQTVMQAHPQQTILIAGAAGHVGTKLVQLAALRGLDVWTTSAPKDFAMLQQLGSQHCLDYHQALPDLGMPPMQHVIATSARVPLNQQCAVLAPGGMVTLITAPTDASFDVPAFYMQRQVMQGFVISHATVTELAQAATQLNQAFAQGKLLDDQVVVKSFAAAAWAHTAMEAGTLGRNKVVLVPNQLK